MKSAWSQVDVVLQRRADLIPNLVETVKGYATQEQTVFGDIANARSALLSAGSPQQKIAASGARADGKLVIVAARPFGDRCHPSRTPALLALRLGFGLGHQGLFR